MLRRVTSGRSRLWYVVRALGPLLLAFSVWWPHHTHFDVSLEPPPAAALQGMLSEPSAKTLEDVGSIRLMSFDLPASRKAAAARAILDGELDARPLASKVFRLQGYPADLRLDGGPTFQLGVASFGTEELLLDAYEESRDPRYLQAARARVLQFAEWEARQSTPVEFTWNDHAIAARIPVVARLWSLLRNTGENIPEQERQQLLTLVGRSGALLAKPDHFTVRTNHGVMQNVGLLQIGAAFPYLPQAAQWRALALQRLEMQLAFLVSDEGVVLEHSSHYHFFGEELFGYALRLIALNGLEPPQRLVSSVQRIAEFSKILRRPDGTAPLLGNTSKESREPAGTLEPPAPGNFLFPLSGYALWWTGAPVPAQTTVAWAKHDRHGHKHADEPSLHFWSRGMDWITAVGYWPYGYRGLVEANGWGGSNAPHQVGEAADSPRTVRLLGASSGKAAPFALDVENARLGGFTVRRQVVQLQAEQLLVLDEITGASRPVHTIWTTDARVSLQPAGTHQFHGTAANAAGELQLAFASESGADAAAGTGTKVLRESWDPFAGWTVIGVPVPADSVVVERPKGRSMTAALITVRPAGGPRSSVAIGAGSQGDRWEVTIRNSGGEPQMIRRRAGTIEIAGPGPASASVDLVAPAADLPTRQSALKTSMQAAIDLYPPWRDLSRYHWRIYALAVALWAGIEAFLFGISFLKTKRDWKPVLNPLVVCTWVFVGWWVHARYLT